jgi:hypothetical protein
MFIALLHPNCLQSTKVHSMVQLEIQGELLMDFYCNDLEEQFTEVNHEK